jgi:hypothetical protein
LVDAAGAGLYCPTLDLVRAVEAGDADSAYVFQNVVWR